MVTERTLGQKVEQWITNLKLLIPFISLLGLSSIYGNSETVKNLVHGKPEVVPAEPKLVVEVLPAVKPVEHKHDNHNARFSKIEKRVKKLETKVNANTINITTNSRWHE